MTKKEMVLNALENIIIQRGILRDQGITIDELPREFNKVIDAAWAAYYDIKDKGE